MGEQFEVFEGHFSMKRYAQRHWTVLSRHESLFVWRKMYLLCLLLRSPIMTSVSDYNLRPLLR